jgi:hypothetical protein
MPVPIGNSKYSVNITSPIKVLLVVISLMTSTSILKTTTHSNTQTTQRAPLEKSLDEFAGGSKLSSRNQSQIPPSQFVRKGHGIPKINNSLPGHDGSSFTPPRLSNIFHSQSTTKDACRSPLLSQRSLQRIPGYIEECNDIPLTNFLSKLALKSMSAEEWAKTTIAIFSDDVQANPVLFMKLSSNITRYHNVDKYITPLDLRRTLRGLVIQDSVKSNGTTLTSPLPKQRSSCGSILDLNKESCTDDSILSEVHHTDEIPSPPSILSFYADIPKKRKLQLHIEQLKDYPKRAKVGQGCMCATNVQTWFKCDNSHPWDIQEDFREYFMLVDCPGKPIHLEVSMLPNEVLLKRSRSKRANSGYSNATNVNIIFLEVDSVSQEYADRHFPMTRELLKEYRLRWNEETRQFDCPSEICSADFSKVSLVGANSIPNQVAALSGCLSSSSKNVCGLAADIESVGQSVMIPLNPPTVCVLREYAPSESKHIGVRCAIHRRKKLHGYLASWKTEVTSISLVKNSATKLHPTSRKV